MTPKECTIAIHHPLAYGEPWIIIIERYDGSAHVSKYLDDRLAKKDVEWWRLFLTDLGGIVTVIDHSRKKGG